MNVNFESVGIRINHNQTSVILPGTEELFSFDFINIDRSDFFFRLGNDFAGNIKLRNDFGSCVNNLGLYFGFCLLSAGYKCQCQSGYGNHTQNFLQFHSFFLLGINTLVKALSLHFEAIITRSHKVVYYSFIQKLQNEVDSFVHFV